jgi:acetyltransferase-like isoleucine patch superfamily enzyme
MGAKLIQLCYKIWLRGADVLRGILFYVLVRSCGGVCLSVPRVGKGVTFKYPPHKGIVIGLNCSIGPGCIFDVPPNGKLQVGDNVKLTAGVYISAASSVSVGSDVLIAEGVSIRDSDHLFFLGSAIRKQGLQYGRISIEDDVWIGRSTAILMNSTILSGCIVGAGSMVRKSVLDANGIYVGVPARKVAERVALK